MSLVCSRHAEARQLGCFAAPCRKQRWVRRLLNQWNKRISQKWCNERRILPLLVLYARARTNNSECIGYFRFVYISRNTCSGLTSSIAYEGSEFLWNVKMGPVQVRSQAIFLYIHWVFTSGYESDERQMFSRA